MVAVIAGFGASGDWLTVLLALNGAEFGVKDPIFGHDIGFYVFSMPALASSCRASCSNALIASLVFAAIVHLVMGGIEYRAAPPAARRGRAGHALRAPPGAADAAGAADRRPPRRPRRRPPLGASSPPSSSWSASASSSVPGNLLYSTAGAMFGAGYTDVAIRLPLTRVTMVLAFVLAALLIYNIWRRHRWWPVAIAVWIIALIVLRGIVPAAYQSLVVNPNQLAKERQYISHNIDATEAGLRPDRPSLSSRSRRRPRSRRETWPTTRPRCATSGCGTPTPS